MSLLSLARRVQSMTSAIERGKTPRFIDCTGAKEELIARLLTIQERSELENNPHVFTPEDIAEMEAFDAFMSEVVERTEQAFNVRFYSRDAN